MKKTITKEELEILIDDEINNLNNFGIDYDYKSLLKNYLKEYEIKGENIG